MHIELQPKIVKASIVLRFTIFRYRRMFCRARKKLKKGWKVKVDLTKSRLLYWRKPMTMWRRYPLSNFVIRMWIVALNWHLRWNSFFWSLMVCAIVWSAFFIVFWVAFKEYQCLKKFFLKACSIKPKSMLRPKLHFHSKTNGRFFIIFMLLMSKMLKSNVMPSNGDRLFFLILMISL